VTRASLRQALIDLTADGLVERIPNRGARVRVVTTEEAVAITECRMALEALCAAKAAERVTDDEAAKLRLLASTGLDGAVVLTFDAALAKLTAEEFVSQILVERFAISGAVIGFNFHFGMNRAGSPNFLIAQGKKYGFAVEVVPRFEDNGRPVSSGPIRDALAAGNVRLADEFLGYPWFVTGAVIHGDKRGRELGFPTANIRLDSACALRHGIYAVRINVDGRHYDAVANFGRRPMFDTGAVLLEIFLFDFSGDLYGRNLDVAFIEWIREERMFDGTTALITQMKEDSRLAREALRKSGDAFPPI